MRIAFIQLLLLASTLLNNGQHSAVAKHLVLMENNEPLVAAFNGESVEIGSQLFIYEDHDYSLNIRKAVEPAFASNFIRNTKDIGNAGNTKAIIWCRFRIQNNTDLALFLALSNPLVNDAVLYEVNTGSGTIDSTLYSAFYPFKDRAILIPDFAFPLKIPLGEGRTYFLKFETTYPLDFPLSVSTEAQILHRHNFTSLLEGLFFGVVVIMILYNFFLFLGIRDKIYLSYILYVVAMGLFVTHIKGFAFTFIWPEIPWMNRLPALLPCLAASAALFFSSQFLQVKKYHLGVFRLFQFCYAFFGLAMVLNLIHLLGVFESRLIITVAAIVIQVTVVLACMTLVVGGIKAYRRGFSPAKAYLVAWVSLLSSVTTFLMYNIGLLPRSTWITHSMEFGVALEACLLSFALTIKINQERNDREKAEQLVLTKEREAKQLALQKEIEKSKLIEEEKARLEITVAERTKELRKLNSTKDHFFSIISHDLRSVISSFHGIGHMIKQNLKRERFQKAEILADQLDQEANNLHTLLDNLLNWSINQLGETPFVLEKIDLNASISEVYELYLQTAKSKEITFEMVLEKDLKVEGDFDALNIILRNLVSNGIKFTKAGGKVVITAEKTNGLVQVKISDTGTGINDNIISAINESVIMTSASGTSGEKGNGLGLKLCKEYLLLHDSNLEIGNHQKGAWFRFSLKSAS